MKTNTIKAARPLVVNRLENVSKDVFKKYYPLITELVGNSPGIYALYDGTDLYYVGKSTELRKRVRHHLIDRHLASWTHFSLYLVRREEHIHEFESLLVRIANPKGNRVIPRGKSTGVMVDQLKKMIQQKQKEELVKLFGTKSAAGRKVSKNSKVSQRTIKGMVTKRTVLYRTYKGKEYKATLSPTGVITFAGQRYQSPSAAAKAVIKGKGAANGWSFWYIKNSGGDWVRLMDYEG
jgi:Restriction Enzyme Adenine Methylase Associated